MRSRRAWAVMRRLRAVSFKGRKPMVEHSQLDEQVKKARVEVLPHAKTGRGAFTKVTLSNGHSEMFAGRLGKREAVSNTLDAWNRAMLQRSHVSPRPALPPGTTRG